MDMSSARFTRRYTDEQKRAMLEAHILQGLSVAECMRRARAGTLKPGMAPFGSAGRFAYDMIAKARETFEATNEEALAAGTEKALKEAHIANLKALRSLPEDCDPEKRARTAKALADTQRARAVQAPRGKAKAKPGAAEAETPTTPMGPDVLGQLVQLAG